jgi:hypothetical protein
MKMKLSEREGRLPVPFRLFAALKGFLWFSIIGGVVAPLSYVSQKARHHKKPFGLDIFTYSIIVIVVAYAFTLIVVLLALKRFRRNRK